MAFFEQDFVMRQIQYLTQLLQQIIFKKKQNKDKEAQELLQNAFNRLTKEHPKQFHELSLKETLQLFSKENQFESELAVAVADLLVQEGGLLREKSFRRSQKSYLQALLLYKKSLLDSSTAVPVDIQQKIQPLERNLKHSGKLNTIDQLVETN